MSEKPSGTVRPILLYVLLWLCGVSLMLMIKDVVEQFTGQLGDDSMDLATVLVAYVLLFTHKPIRHWNDRRLRKHSRRRQLDL